MKRSLVPLNKLEQEPYSKIIGFPKATKSQIKSRVKELKKIGVSAIVFEGKTQLGTLGVLGKGYVGVVVLARRKNKWVALKIRRMDSQRNELKSEAKLLEFVNKLGVGPKFFAVTKNFIVMEYLDGEKIGDWVIKLEGKGSVKKIKDVIRKILEDCYSLDMAGLDHGELSSITKHVIIGKKTTLIDFDSSSLDRRVSNVTSATQGIFIGSGISKSVSKLYKIPDIGEIVNVLRVYKQNKTRKDFENVLAVLKL
jgi:putative serine/threonine protein kinase